MSGMALGPTQPLIQGVLGFFPGVKWLGCDIHNSLPYTTEVKDE